MKYVLILSIGTAVILMLAGCASNPIAISSVGPGLPKHTLENADGYLRVFSDTEAHEIGDNTYYYLHTGYNIYDDSGKQVRYVSNHVGTMDESPTLVALPAGNYKVVAESASYGRLTVPVLIQAGKTTLVHLNRDGIADPNTPTNELVRLPDGEIIGWMAP